MKIDLNSRTKNTARNTLIGMISQLLQISSSFFCRMVFVRTLSEAYLGVNGLFGNILSILSLSELGIGSAITFELYQSLASGKEDEIKSLMAFFKKAYVLVGIIIAIMGFIFLPYINNLVPLDPNIHEDIRVLYLFFLINTVVSYFFSYKASIIQAAQQDYILTVVHTAVTITQNIFQIIVLITTHNFLLYLCIQLFSTLTYYLIVSFEASRLFPYLNDKDYKPLSVEKRNRLFINIKDLFIASISGKLVNQTDNIILTALGGLTVTGLNSNYSMLVATLISFTAKINDSIQSAIGNVNAVESTERKIALFYEIQFFFYWFYLWCTCSFILLVQDAISLFFGAKYLLPFSVAIITGINYYTTEQGAVANIFKTTLGLFKYGKYMSLLTGLINVVLSVFLGKKYGVFGVLMASFISLMLTTRWYYPYIVFTKGFNVSPIDYYIKDIRYWLEGVAIFFISNYLCSLLSLGIFMNLIYRAVVCLLIPNIMVIILHHRA